MTTFDYRLTNSSQYLISIHYDLTSVFFHGAYKESEMVDLGYSRDHRPDKPHVVFALSTTADGEVPLPGACGVHKGDTL